MGRPTGRPNRAPPPPPPIPPPPPPPPRGGLWERLAPHFEYQWEEGGAVVVDGRMVLAFNRGCEPAELRGELLIISRMAERSETDVFPLYPWKDLREGHPGGFCVAAALLPAGMANPGGRIETMPMSDYLTGLSGQADPIIRSNWDVYQIGRAHV